MTTSTAPAAIRFAPLDRDDAGQVASWARCGSIAYLGDAPDEAEIRLRLRRTEGHRITVALDGDDVVGSYRSFDSTVTLPGAHALPVNAVSGVMVLPTHRRRRLLTSMMAADMTRARDSGVAASILIASEGGIYARFGYGVATTATTWTLDAGRAAFTTPATGQVRIVGPQEWAGTAAEVYAAARHRFPGTIDRTTMRWEAVAQVDPSVPGFDKRRVLALHLDPDGVADGALAYAIKDEYLDRIATATLMVEDLVSSTDAAYADLWRYAAEVDFVTTVVAEDRSPAEPLPLLLADARAARDSAVSDFLWIRLHDVSAALSARRYAVPGRLVLDVTDPLDQVTGAYRLEVDAALAVSCVPTSDPADVRLGVGDLGSLLMGGAPGTTSVAALRRAGRLDASDNAAARATALFSWPDPAWCGTWF